MRVLSKLECNSSQTRKAGKWFICFWYNEKLSNEIDFSFFVGVLVDAMRKGHWIILDELNLAPSDVLEALNRVLYLVNN